MFRMFQFTAVWVLAVMAGFTWAGISGAMATVPPDGVIVASLD